MASISSSSHLESPIGWIAVQAGPRGVEAVHLLDEPPVAATAPPSDLHLEAERQLRAYFQGDLKRFDLPLAEQGTPFQRSVWKLLLEIPYGQTRSYGELANILGSPTLSRAVGLANGSNPVAIIVPCHRVIGSNGSLTGYAGGLPRKEWLLRHEGVVLPATQAALF